MIHILGNLKIGCLVAEGETGGEVAGTLRVDVGKKTGEPAGFVEDGGGLDRAQILRGRHGDCRQVVTVK